MVFTKEEMSEKPLVTQKDLPKRSSRVVRVAFGITIGIVVFASLLVGSAYGYERWLNGRVSHNVTYGGISVALLDAPALRDAVMKRNTELANTSVQVEFQGKTAAVPLSSFTPEFDVDSVVLSILPTSPTINSPWKQFTSMVTTLWRGKNYQPLFTLHQVPSQVSDMVAPSVVTGKDAQFQLADDGTLTMSKESAGTALDAGGLMAAIESGAFVGEPINIELMSVPVQTTEAMLMTMIEPMEKVISSPLQLTFNGKSYPVSGADLLAAANLSSDGGTWQVTLDGDSLGARLDEIAKSVDQAAKPRQINVNTGEVLDQGQDGVTLDRTSTLVAMTTILQARLNSSSGLSSLAIATKTVTPTDQKISPNNTPGMYPGKYIEVDLSSQTLFQYEGENLIHTYRVSTGKWSTPTPIGTYAITNKSPRAYSSPYDLYMPWWMGFIGSTYGIHELPEWPDGRKEGEGHIGTPVSHGCIRLGVGDAQTMYDWAEIGIPVVVHQ